MTKKDTGLLTALEAYVAENGLEVELAVIRKMMREGRDLREVAFLMRDRYPLATLKALQAQMRETGELRAPQSVTRS